MQVTSNIMQYILEDFLNIHSCLTMVNNVDYFHQRMSPYFSSSHQGTSNLRLSVWAHGNEGKGV